MMEKFICKQTSRYPLCPAQIAKILTLYEAAEVRFSLVYIRIICFDQLLWESKPKSRGAS